MTAVPRDTLTPKERLSALAEGRPLDRTPAKPFLGQNAAKLFGSTNRAFNTDPEVTANVLEAVFRRFRPDGITVNAGLQCVAEALGSKFRFPEYGPPVIEEPGLPDYEDVERLEEIDVPKAARLPNFLTAWEDLDSRIGQEVGVDIGLGGPFTAAILLVGLDKLLRDTVHHPESVHRVMRLTTKAIKSLIDRAADLGSPVGLAEPMASSAVVGPRTFKEFAKPYLAEIADYTRQRRGRGLGVHICGKTRKIWPDLAELGLASFSLDNIESLKEAVGVLGDALTLVGNVPPIEVLKDGRPEDVLASAKACLEAAAGSPKGFILASGCEVLVDTPPENIQAMMDAARLHGPPN
jgi:uroporphyrinogen decarboxylase